MRRGRDRDDGWWTKGATTNRRGVKNRESGERQAHHHGWLADPTPCALLQMTVWVALYSRFHCSRQPGSLHRPKRDPAASTSPHIDIHLINSYPAPSFTLPMLLPFCHAACCCRCRLPLPLLADEQPVCRPIGTAAGWDEPRGLHHHRRNTSFPEPDARHLLSLPAVRHLSAAPRCPLLTA